MVERAPCPYVFIKTVELETRRSDNDPVKKERMVPVSIFVKLKPLSSSVLCALTLTSEMRIVSKAFALPVDNSNSMNNMKGVFFNNLLFDHNFIRMNTILFIRINIIFIYNSHKV